MKTMYCEQMNCPDNSSFSPSAGKPKKFIEYLIERGEAPDLLDSFMPASLDDLALAHDISMVRDVLDGIRNNGFGNKLLTVAQTLPYTSGSFLAAAIYAAKSREIVFSPTSGFHHAGHAYSAGFCTFNGLMVAALRLKEIRLVETLGIVDLDMHFGDGTEDIIKKKKLDWIKHYTFGKELISQTMAEHWLEQLPQKLAQMNNVDIVFYQAGADPHIHDPLGGVLTTEQMRKRDEIVFSYFSERKIPVVWNMAGGYQKPLEKVLELHYNTYMIAQKYSK